jgi:hypothetical protein
MENALTNFFTTQTMIFCLIVYLIVQFFRSSVHFIYTKLENHLPKVADTFLEDMWNEFILPVAPILTGCLIAYFVKNYPYPDTFTKTTQSRVFFGGVAGISCGHVYRFFRFYVKKYLPDQINAKIDKIAGSVSPQDKEDN